jgi:hypothetical protein
LKLNRRSAEDSSFWIHSTEPSGQLLIDVLGSAGRALVLSTATEAQQHRKRSSFISEKEQRTDSETLPDRSRMRDAGVAARTECN